MCALWSPEETRRNVIRGINETYIWDERLHSYPRDLKDFSKEVRQAEDVVDKSLKEVLSDILNMDYSSREVRLALQMGLTRARGATLVLGPGGCGKSLIYKAVAHCVPHCLCLAPTGVAAYNLSARGWGDLEYTMKPTTIHSALGFPAKPYFFPYKGKKGDLTAVKERLVGYWEGYNFRNGCRAKDVRKYDIILIDEISMVSPNLLDLIITAAGEMDIPIMMFGDPMQLRPVEVSDKDGSNKTAAMLAGAYPGWNFFNSYAWMALQNTGAAHTVVLKSVYRQSDPGFKSLLNRMRINEPTEEDWKCLESRQETEPPEGSLILCKRNSTVNSINEKFAGVRNLTLTLDKNTISGCSNALLEQLKKRYRVTEGEMTERDRVVFKALSVIKPFNCEKDSKNPKKEVLRYQEDNVYRSELPLADPDLSGFSTEISLYPGDRVMITKNLSTEVFSDKIGAEEYAKRGSYKITGGTPKRIVNGMLGWYLGRIDEIFRPSCREPLAQTVTMPVLVLLDTNEVALVPMMEFSTGTIDSKGEYRTNSRAWQYPIKMAYATTYHKAQGLTLDKVHMILDGEESTWRVPGLAYLGLSRCTSLEGLTIDGLSRSEFIEDEASKNFMTHSEEITY